MVILLFLRPNWLGHRLRVCCRIVAIIMFCYSYLRFKLIFVLLPYFPSLFVSAGTRLQFVRFLFVDASSSPRAIFAASCYVLVDGICGICRETLVPQLIIVSPCNHVFHHSCVDGVLRFVRYRAALSGRVTVECMLYGAPAIVSLLPAFGRVDECRPLPRQVRAVRTGDGFADEDADGPLEP